MYCTSPPNTIKGGKLLWDNRGKTIIELNSKNETIDRMHRKVKKGTSSETIFNVTYFFWKAKSYELLDKEFGQGFWLGEEKI